MRILADIILFLTLSGNVILSLLLVGNRWWIRYNWLTISAIMAILADFAMQFIHFHDHPSFEPLRIFLCYALWPILNILVIWEAFRLGNKVVQYCTEIQLGLLIGWPLIQRAGWHWTAWYVEVISAIFNVFVIAWFITIFRHEAHYESA